jgi:dihydroneopterin aldolase
MRPARAGPPKESARARICSSPRHSKTAIESPMDYVFIEDLKVNGRQGVGSMERQVEHFFNLWLKMWFDARPAGASDNLRDALDYRPVRQMIIDLMQNESFHLIEQLGEVICAKILNDKRIAKVELIIKKTDLLTDCVPGICITRENI